LSSEAAITQALDVAQAARDQLAVAAAIADPTGNPSSGSPSSTIKSLHAALAPIATWLPEISNLLTQAYLIHVFARQA
jgi:hypothetical protein